MQKKDAHPMGVLGWVGMRMFVTPSLRSGVGRGCSFAPPRQTPSSETGLQPNVTLHCVSGEILLT